MYLYVYVFVWKEEQLHWISYTNSIFEVKNIDFWQIWYFDVNRTGWVSLQLSIILMQTVGRFAVWVSPK